MTDLVHRDGSSAQRLEQTLSAPPNAPFSSAAFAVLQERVEDYIADLIEEAAKTSKRCRSDTISAAHVEQAASYLTLSTRNRIFRHVGTIGGILFGAGLSTILALLVAGPISPRGLLVASGCSIVGAFLVAMHIAKD
jgi:hypothetical protein